MPRRHALRSFVQTVVLADGSALRRPEFLSKNQPRVLVRPFFWGGGGNQGSQPAIDPCVGLL